MSMHMMVWAALFRGINVGGHNIIRMKDLAALLEGLGFSGVRTYIQSGNAVFLSKEKKANAIARMIRKSVAETHGFEPHMLALTQKALEAAAKANPFPEGEDDPRSLHFFFLEASPKKPDLDKLNALKSDSERFAIIGRVFYLHAPEGIGRSKLAVRAEHALGVPATARNWRTVDKIIEMARGAG